MSDKSGSAWKREDIQEKVVDIVFERFYKDKDRPRSDIKEATSFITDLGADSLDTAELMMEIEAEFDISIPEGDNEIRTVGDAVTFIEKEVAKAGSGAASD